MMRSMGLLGRLRRSHEMSPGEAVDSGLPSGRFESFSLFEGTETLEVVGESHRQDELWRLVGGCRREYVSYPVSAMLWPEAWEGERADPNAVQVKIEGCVVGYLSRHDAALYRPGIVALMAECATGRVGLGGEICGGGERVDGIGYLGVFLQHNPATFGVTPRQASDIPGFRTGLSEAMATDAEDDSYDLSWLPSLPTSDGPAIKALRKLLEDERDPIDRHYMHGELEERLYRCRDAFATALDDYDAACELHHADMETIRPALFEKFGRMPVLDTYRQAAIRAQKARDWQAVQRWASRGIELYGSDAARPEAVDDLRKRLARAAGKLGASNLSG